MEYPYDIRTRTTRKKIAGDSDNILKNKVYKSLKGKFYFFINKRGFFHILIPCRVNKDGKFSHYEITEYLLTADDNLKEIKTYGNFKTREKCLREIYRDKGE